MEARTILDLLAEVKNMHKPGRNDPCHCGSEKKYKKCHLYYDEQQELMRSEKLYTHKKRQSEFRDNLALNRREGEKDHYYFDNFGWASRFTHEFKGLVKVKLVHALHGSVVIPEVILFKIGENYKWVQPFGFLPNTIAMITEKENVCSIYVDICSGRTIRVRFENKGLLRSFQDGSELYECTITGPEEFESLATGTAIVDFNYSVYLRLFHHTSEKAKSSIESGKSFRLSSWNIQGTKNLENVGYVYFTSLPAIIKDGDLRQIAMSSEGKIELVKDGFSPPSVVFGESVSSVYPDDAIELKVYREDTKNRTHTIELHVPVELLASQHIHYHIPLIGPAYYLVCCPFIHRVALTPGKMLHFSDDKKIYDRDLSFRYFGYVIMGNCTTKDGLAAPYDEETTSHIAKIEFIDAGSDILEFWHKNPNRDLFTPKEMEKYSFKVVSI